MSIKTILIVALVASFSLTALAQSSPTGSGFFASVAAKGGLGNAGSDNKDSVEDRDMSYAGGELNLGWRTGAMLFGVTGEYNMWMQRTDPKDVDDSNIKGKQMNLSPMFGMGFGNFLFTVRSQLYSKMTLDKKTTGGDEVVFAAPAFPAYGVQLNYRLGGSSYVGVEYQSVSYEEAESGGETTKLKNKNKVTYSGYGLVYGFIF